MDPIQIAQEKVEARARCKRDKFYLADVLGYDFQPDTHAELFSCFVQYKDNIPWGEQSEVKDRMILWPRGHYKTTAVVVEIIQMILNNPNIRILIMQGSIPVTKTLLKQVISHFTGDAEGSRLQELFPEFCGVKDSESGAWTFGKKILNGSSMQFTTTARTRKQLAQATVNVASPRSVKTGQHYSAAFFDDLVNEANYRNPKLLQKVQDDFTLAQSLVDPGNYRMVTGTRYAFGDLYEQILRWSANSGKWLISVKDCWTDETANLPDADKKPRFPRFTKKNGELGGFTTEELLQMQTDDPSTFANQYLNKPIHSSKQAYTKELLYGACVAFQDTPALSQPILMVDLASGETETADDSVITCGRIDALGCGYLTDLRGGQWTPSDLAMHVIDMALRHRPVKILFEGTASCKYFMDFLRLVARQKNVFLPVDSIKVDNKVDAKNMRVVALAGVIRRKKFKFVAGLSSFDKLVEQAITFPKAKWGHDDYIDTAALLYQELSKEMMSLPVRPFTGSPIFALIADADRRSVFPATEEQENVNQQDMTGWE